jgi:hypothetical protein
MLICIHAKIWERTYFDKYCNNGELKKVLFIESPIKNSSCQKTP